MNYNQLVELKKTIENFSEDKQLEIFRIIKENNMNFTENQNGIFLNLSELTPLTLKKISDYLIYIKKQESFIKIIEKQKLEYKEMIDEEAALQLNSSHLEETLDKDNKDLTIST